MRLRVFLVDDERPARERMRELLADIGSEVPNEVTGEAGTGMEALEALAAIPTDVVLLDIRMPGMDGLELARNLVRLAQPPAIVFVTSYEAHAVEAFELHALDYLLKPVRARRLADALQRARSSGAPSRAALDLAAGRSREHLPVVERNRIALVRVCDILYFKAEQKYVTLRTREREHLIEEPLVALEREFADTFVRIHRNCLVAKDGIRGFERSAEGDEEQRWVVLLDGIPEQLPVSRRQWPLVRALAADAGGFPE